jgi:5-methylcytosine-specific restriction endonuclease McrA
MKRTPLKRKTPLKATTALQPTELKPVSKQRFASSEMKRRVYGRDRGICYLCGEWFAYDDTVAEHVIPKGRGGQTTLEGLRVACRPCNRAKGNKTGEEYLAELGKRGSDASLEN